MAFNKMASSVVSPKFVPKTAVILSVVGRAAGVSGDRSSSLG